MITTIFIQTKKRALAMADYMAEYGIEVLGVKIRRDGSSTISCIGDSKQITDIINQFNNDYNE